MLAVIVGQERAFADLYNAPELSLADKMQRLFDQVTAGGARRVRFVFDDLVCADEVAINVRKVSLELSCPITNCQEERTSSEEGLVVIGEMLRDVLQEMVDYASLAAGPFYEGS